MAGDIIRQAVLIDIAFEIGGAGLAGFHDLLTAYRNGQWATAAVALKNSLLFLQVPFREQENMMILILREFPNGVNCAKDLIKKHEGFLTTAQPDKKGKWVLGYGHDIDAPTAGIPCCTRDEAEVWFEEDFRLASQRAQDDLGSDYWVQEKGDIT